MNKDDLASLAKKLVSNNKGLLAADESTGTIKKRLASVGLESTPEMNRKYRQMLVTTHGIEEYISGIILFDETVRQELDDGTSFPDYIDSRNIVPGIKVDEGREPFSEDSKEEVTKGVEGLAKRLPEYKKMNLKFTKWRAPILIDDGVLPTKEAILENAKRMAEYAYISQENDFVPIVEPEVLMDGEHTTTRCEEVTKITLQSLYEELDKKDVFLKGTLLKTNMVLPGKGSGVNASPLEVANATLRALLSSVPKEVPGIVFLSGGQEAKEATANLNEINKLKKDAPWELSFSFARALQKPALEVWKGKDENVKMAQETFYHRAKMNHLARKGEYRPEMEGGK